MLTMLASAGSIFQTAEFWVAVSFFGFAALIVHYNVPGLIGKALDDRADTIRRELDAARQLREEAETLLADYKRKTATADEEAKAIVDQARLEAELLTEETRKNLAEMLERRSRLAEEKIARAEVQAVTDVRTAAAEMAVAAAERILRTSVSPQEASELVDNSIRDLKGRLN